jgi:hypothetical protein
MAKKHKTEFPLFLKLLFGMVFLCLALFLVGLTVQIASQPTVTQTKAAQTQIILKGWEFAGTTLEDWTASNMQGLTTSNNYLTGKVTAASSVVLSNLQVQTNLPLGTNVVRVRLAAGTRTTYQDSEMMRGTSVDEEYTKSVRRCAAYPVWCENSDKYLCKLLNRIPGWCPKTAPSVTPQPMPSPTCRPMPPCQGSQCPNMFPGKGWCPRPDRQTYTLSLSYAENSDTAANTIPAQTGVADGQMREYTFRFPLSNSSSLHSIRLQLDGLKAGDLLSVDYVRIVNVASIEPTREPSNCHYEQVECVKAPCNPILVCPSVVPTGSSQTSCNGKEDGSVCNIGTCPTCNGPTCPKNAMTVCRLLTGICKNGVCVRRSDEVLPTTPPYTCPPPGYVNCMPMVIGPDEQKPDRSNCSPDFLSWAKINCPDFKGAAY